MGSSVVVTLALYTMLGSETVVFQGAGSFFAAVASMYCGGLISFLMILSILSMHE